MQSLCTLSSPLSPAATQHSLPSGRYPLLGPDFHRLDRTSLRLAHSLDHLVGAREQRRRQFEAKRLEATSAWSPAAASKRSAARPLAPHDVAVRREREVHRL